MALPVIFVVNAIAGTAIRFTAKKAAQNFIKKYGGKIVNNAGKRKVLSSTASGVKRFIDSFSKGVKKPTNVRGGSRKNIANKTNKEDQETGKEKKTNYHTENLGLRGAIPRNERKKQSLVVKSVKASVRSPLHDLAHREPQQHGSSCRRNLHLRAS